MGLLDRIRRNQHSAVPRTIPPAPPGPVPLSFAQQRLWFLDQMSPGTAEYVMPFGYRVAGTLDVAVLEQAFTGLVARHEILRTSFVTGPDGEPLQVVGKPWPVRVGRCGPGDMQARALEPFDLAGGRLLRVWVTSRGPADHDLLICMHHIVGDGWSVGVLAQELSELYAAGLAGRPAVLPALRLQYADYAVWQREWLSGGVLDRQLGYWRERLGGLEAAELPLDRPRPAARSAAVLSINVASSSS